MYNNNDLFESQLKLIYAQRHNKFLKNKLKLMTENVNMLILLIKLTSD